MNELLSASLPSLHTKLKHKQVSAVELAGIFLDRAQQVNSTTQAFITIDPDVTLAHAKKADQALHTGDQTPLTGIPFCLKDAYVTQDFPTTCASNVLAKYYPPYNATVYQKLLVMNAVPVGKNNQDAWGHGSYSENTDFGSVKNPWNLAHVAGGSSGGTAAALAASASVFGIGEDTGGSIRNPSSFCNITGLKVTYGRVSRYGAIAYASSLDTVGPMARSVEDLSQVLECIAGSDPFDASSSSQPVDAYSKSLKHSLKGKKLGIIREFAGDSLNYQVKSSLQAATEVFAGLGVELVEVSLPTLKHGVSIYYILAFSETSSNLARYDGVRYGVGRDKFSLESKRRIMTGSFALSSGYYDAYYKKALQARTQLIQEFNQAFTQVDALIGPVMPDVAPKLKPERPNSDDPLAEYLSDLYTCAINPAGVPSLALPAGFSESGLPIGMQLIGPMFSESLLLNIGYQYQQLTNWHTKFPSL